MFTKTIKKIDFNIEAGKGWDSHMSLKKELLNELDVKQLKELVDTKGITFRMNGTKKKYYDGWDEKDKLVDLMTDHKGITIGDIESFIVDKKV